MFVAKQIVWAKTKSYPWWPAQINKLPCSQHNYFKVTFLGQTNHALLQQKAVRKYFDNYEAFKKINYKGLQASIQLADMEIQKRKAHLVETQNKNKINKNGVQKVKKLKKKKKLKLKGKNNLVKQTKIINDNLKSLKNDDSEKKFSQQCLAIKGSDVNKQVDNKSEIQSEFMSQQLSSVQIDELDYLRNVDRKKIQSTQQKLFVFITRFNSGIYDKQRQCYDLIVQIGEQDFKQVQLLQSKITNMISYLDIKLSERGILKKEQIQRIEIINKKLKKKVIDYLFDCKYYDQYLKRMQKNIILPIIQKQKQKQQKKQQKKQKQQKIKNQTRSYIKKNRKYKRRIINNNKSIIDN